MNPKNNDIMVYKANKLIEARYNLDLNEQKLILYAASKIDSLSDEKFPRIELSLSPIISVIFPLSKSVPICNHPPNTDDTSL